MLSVYIGVYRAVFEYAAQTDEELNLAAGDILYLLEKSDVDDWWTVKKRILPVGDEEVEEPVGLVPSNYIEEAPVVKTARALYDYEKQTEEELSFKEGDRFDVYDVNDPDWILVTDAAHEHFGFVPANYIDMSAQLGVALAPANPQAFSMPPKHPSQIKRDAELDVSPKQEQPLKTVDQDYEEAPPKPARPTSNDFVNNSQTENELNLHDEEEDAPPMPSRPGPSAATTLSSINREPAVAQSSQDYPRTEDVGDQQHSYDGEFFTWYIDEVDGRKKRPVVFSIGKGMIVTKPNSQNPKKLKLKSASTLDQVWRVRDLKDYSNEKKHLFLELTNPTTSLELHCGLKDVAEAIVSILADLKGAEEARGLREVAQASQASTSGKNRKIGTLMFDFTAQSRDELESREGDEVYIIDQSKSKDWWMCENVATGRQGVIPASYIEIVGTSNLDKMTDGVQRRRSQKAPKGKVVEKKHQHRRRSRDERERIRESDQRHRERDQPSNGRDSDGKSLPNYHRLRTWIDSTGSFKVEAEFLGFVDGKIHLHKTNGVKIAVAATKLCLEDLEYVEKVSGTSLETYKEQVSKHTPKKSEEGRSRSATAVINSVSPTKEKSLGSGTIPPQSDPEYDWFEFFLQCGIDIGNCQRYTINFNREQMDDKILEDINPSLLRTLGLREGDIIRVMKYLDNKFDRKKEEPVQQTATGSLFTEPTGALRNNSSTTEVSKVDAKALPSPRKPETLVENPPQQVNKLDDDAWAMKPAARSNEDLLRVRSQTPQYTGSLQDLVDIKPFKVNDKPMPALPTEAKQEPAPSAPALKPVQTGPSIQPGQQFAANKTGSTTVGGLGAQTTGGLVPVQRTGGLVPVQRTGGLLPMQPTGFVPITAQPTGFIPIQATGLQPQITFGIVPLQTGTATFTATPTGPQASMPQTTFGQQQPQLQPSTTFGGMNKVPLQMTGGAMPATSFGQPMTLQQTGPLVPAQRTGGTPFGQQTGPIGNQLTGGLPPQTSFGMFQPTGQQSTGGPMLHQGPPANSFGPGSISSPPTFMNQNPGTITLPQPAFPTGQQPFNLSFPGSQTGQEQYGQPNMNLLSNMFQNTNISSNGYQPPTSFGQPQASFQSSFGQQPSFGQQQTSFGQQQTSFGQQPTSFGQPPTSFGQQPSSFGQPAFGQQPLFDGFGYSQPLQSQPTGSGFGNAPLQSQQTGRRANLQAATADNPFGF